MAKAPAKESPAKEETVKEESTDRVKHESLDDAILAVMGEVPYILKEKSSGLKYTFASEEALIEKLNPAMRKHGLTIRPVGVEYDRTTYRTKSGGEMQVTLEKVKFKISQVDCKEHDIIEALGEGADGGDKSAGKSGTNAMKYALRQTFLIQTGDDPDKEASVPRADLSIPKRKEGVSINDYAKEVDKVVKKAKSTNDLDAIHRQLDAQDSSYKVVCQLLNNQAKSFARK